VGPPGSLATFASNDELTFLATYPPGGTETVSDKNPLVAALDGSYWVRCVSGACLLVTRNHGQTWQNLNTPAPADWVGTADGRTVYIAVHDDAGSRLQRSTDGGATWADVPGLTGLPERSARGMLLPNGDLLMTSATKDGGVYRLVAGASTVDKVAGAPAHLSALYRTGGWLVASSVWDLRHRPDFGSVVSASPDNGATWIAVAPPAE
jgi:hypothetical protein